MKIMEDVQILEYSIEVLYFNFTTCGEKIYIKRAGKPSKINGF